MAASSSPPDNTKSTSICQVCGDNASIINYGVLTCPSCRTFFRRNGFRVTKVCLKKKQKNNKQTIKCFLFLANFTMSI